MASMSSAQIVSVSAMQNRANHPQAAAAAAAAEYGSQVMTTRATSLAAADVATDRPAAATVFCSFDERVCVCCVFVFADLAFTHVCCCC